MRKKINLFVWIAISGTALYGCTKSDSFSSSPLSDFTPSRSGQYITYRLDSTVAVNYGTQRHTTSYLLKDVVDTIVTDNSGRPGWRVFRYISDTANTTGWTPLETYLVTPTGTTVEVLENSLRFVKLALPVANNFSWHGNSHLPYNPLEALFLFNTSYNIDWSGWNYTYQDVNVSSTYNGKTYDSTITVLQVNDSTATPLIGSSTFWEEKYAPHIGLIYKEVQMWEYQASFSVSNCYYVTCLPGGCDTIDCTQYPNRCDSISRLPIVQAQSWIQHCKDSIQTGFYYTGYGIKMTIIDHN